MTEPESETPVGISEDEPRRPGQRKWWWIGGIGVAVGVALATWFGISASAGVHWTDTGQEVVDSRTIKLRFDVTADPGRPVTCTLKALGYDHSVVGSRTVRLAGSPHESTTHVEPVRTTERAVTGQVDTCAYAESSR